MTKEKVILGWSGGKDSALCLHYLTAMYRYDVVGLLTNFNLEDERVIMHDTPHALLQAQAGRIGIPLTEVWLSQRFASNVEYEEEVHKRLILHKQQGVHKVAYGDLFLEDIRTYREELLSKAGMRGLYPLWQRDTRTLVKEFIQLGFTAIVVCVDIEQLDQSFVGRVVDADFLRDLPPGVDPGGENGEYHSFVIDGPMFRTPMNVTLGEQYTRGRFHYQNLVLPS